MKRNKPILLVEDDSIDVMTFKAAWEEINVSNKLIVTSNGEDALELLRDPQNERPCLILLDLNMPRMNGIEFLKIAKNDEKLNSIPVVILTTSEEERDKVDSFNLGAAGYMIKPVEYKEFIELVIVIDLYWTWSELPE